MLLKGEMLELGLIWASCGEVSINLLSRLTSIIVSSFMYAKDLFQGTNKWQNISMLLLSSMQLFFTDLARMN